MSLTTTIVEVRDECDERLTKVHLSAFSTFLDPGPPGHEAKRSASVGASSRLPMVNAWVALRRERAKATLTIMVTMYDGRVWNSGLYRRAARGRERTWGFW